MTLKTLVSPLRNMFAGNLLRYIEIALVASVITFVGFLWFSRANALDQLDKCNKANIEATTKLAQITQDIQDVRVKQELAVQERSKLQKETTATLAKISKQQAPKDCKSIVKWAVENKDDTKW